MIYFDHSATGMPKSEGVINAVASAMRYCGNPSRGSHILSEAGGRAVYDCREQLASLFGTVSENCILTKNATEALNIAVKGYILGQKEITPVAVSDFDHNSVTRILYDKVIKQKSEIREYKTDLFDDQKTLESFKAVIDGGARLAVLTHASNVCGRIFPIKEMVKYAKRHGVAVITDIAQTAGILDIKAGEYGDILCLAGHKGLYGPAGTGAMIIAKDFKKQLNPLLHGGTGILSESRMMPDILPERFEAGTLNAPAYAGLAQAVRESGDKNKRLYEKVFLYLLEQLQNMKGVTVIGAPKKGTEDKWLPIILFNLWGYGSEEASEMLARENFAVRGGLHCAPKAHKYLGTAGIGGVRISIGRGNTLLQARALIDTLACKMSR